MNSARLQRPQRNRPPPPFNPPLKEEELNAGKFGAGDNKNVWEFFVLRDPCGNELGIYLESGAVTIEGTAHSSSNGGAGTIPLEGSVKCWLGQLQIKEQPT